MSIKSKNNTVGIGLMVVITCIVVTGLWAVLAIPETALAKKPDKTDDRTYYSVTMTGDLSLHGAWDCEGYVEITPPDKWGYSFETGIRVNRPSPRICIAAAFLGEVTLDGDDCSDCDGVIPHGNGPNWGTLKVEGGSSGVFVTYYIGETDAVTGKQRLYTLRTDNPVPVMKTQGNGTWPNGDGNDQTIYTVTIPGPTDTETGMSWSLVQAKPGNLNTTLTSTQDTVITFTEYTGS